MNIYIKSIVGMGIPFFLIITVASFMFGQAEMELYRSIVVGVIFGLVGSVSSAFMHNRAVKKITSDVSSESFEVSHTRSIDANMEYEEVFNLCSNVAYELSGFKVIKKDKSEGVIFAKSNFSKGGWGNVAKFELEKLDKNKTRVHIITRPRSKWTLVDYGENLRNIISISDFIEAINACRA